jgi:hypothetical protein
LNMHTENDSAPASQLKQALKLSDQIIDLAGAQIFERSHPLSESDLKELIELRDRMWMHHLLLHAMTNRTRRDLGQDFGTDENEREFLGERELLGWLARLNPRR